MKHDPDQSLLVFRGTVILPNALLENGVVLCRDGKIQAVGPVGAVKVPEHAKIVDAGDGFVSPGFVDIHVHGGDGADFMDGTPDAILTANASHTRHGTTTIYPTTATGSRTQIRAMLLATKTVRDQWQPNQGTRIGGVHFYGPYFAFEQLGAHAPHGRRDPDEAEYLAALEMDIIGVATCAAELPGAETFYRQAVKRGCLVTCGHSNASWTEMAKPLTQA